MCGIVLLGYLLCPITFYIYNIIKFTGEVYRGEKRCLYDWTFSK